MCVWLAQIDEKVALISCESCELSYGWCTKSGNRRKRESDQAWRWLSRDNCHVRMWFNAARRAIGDRARVIRAIDGCEMHVLLVRFLLRRTRAHASKGGTYTVEKRQYIYTRKCKFVCVWMQLHKSTVWIVLHKIKLHCTSRQTCINIISMINPIRKPLKTHLAPNKFNGIY